MTMASVVNFDKQTPPADRGVLVDRASTMIPFLKANAQRTEEQRRVSPETIEKFRDAELLRILQPARVGGFEYDFKLMVDVLIEVGRGCTSSAWVLGLGIVHHWILAQFPPEAQQDVWGTDTGALIVGSYAPSATAKPDVGGYRVSGTWAFTSGVDNASWALVGVMFPPEPGETKPQAGFLLVPAKDYSVKDNWHTYGLCGTGSKDIVLDDVFVPAHRKLTFAEASSGLAPGSVVNPGGLYRIPFLAAVPASLVSPALGAAQGAIDDFVDTVSARTTRGAVAGGGNRMAEFASIQSRVAEAMACVDAARVLITRDCDEVLALATAGTPISIDNRIRNRRSQSFAVKLAVQATDALNACTGGGGLNLGNVTQRAWRDANAVAKHISLNWDAVSTMVGQHALGLEPKGQY